MTGRRLSGKMAETLKKQHEILPRKMAGRLAARRPTADLSEIGLESRHRLTKGRSNKVIGTARFLHADIWAAGLKTLSGKLKVKDRIQAAIRAIRHANAPRV